MRLGSFKEAGLTLSSKLCYFLMAWLFLSFGEVPCPPFPFEVLRVQCRVLAC